jgi:pyruvate/2-oxoglutarate dehydrogenase complex dihydrolipoamide dehydrogenase (E3) component
MANNYDVIIIGSGPGGYVAAIRVRSTGPEDGHCRT